jgi:hypothetical protein
MSGNEANDPSFAPPVIELFVKALILAEKENASEIGVDHLLTALDSPTTRTEAVEQSMGPLVPTPHRDKPFSSEARTAIEAAGGRTTSGLEQLTLDSLRRALLAARRSQ